MVTRTIALKQIYALLAALAEQGYQPTMAYLFGSLAKGTAHEHSDIDLALWDKRFTGSLMVDYEPIVGALIRFPRLELHTFPAGEDETTNPFIGEIKKHGIPIDLTSVCAAVAS